MTAVIGATGTAIATEIEIATAMEIAIATAMEIVITTGATELASSPSHPCIYCLDSRVHKQGGRAVLVLAGESLGRVDELRRSTRVDSIRNDRVHA